MRTYVLQDADGQTLRHALDLGRPGLPGRRPRARLAEGNRPGQLPRRDRRRGHERLLGPVPHRGHHPGHRVGPRPGRRPAGRPRARSGWPDPGQPVRPRRQGRGHRLEMVRAYEPPARSASAFGKASADNRAALVGYLPAGFPTVAGAIEAARAMGEAGADLIEIGLPYSDPLMDGPVIAEAVHRALAGGIRVADVLATVEAVAAAGHPRPGHDLLEPGRPVRRARLRPRPGPGGRLGADHTRPHARGGRLLAGGLRRLRSGPGVPGRAELHRRTHRHRSPGPAAGSSTPPR